MSKNTQIVLALLTLLTIVLWYLSIPSLPIPSRAPLRLLSQILGNLTVLYMAVSLLLSMRLKIIDKVFGGLTISYKIHAIIGSLACIVMLAHPLLLVFNALPNINAAFGYVFFGSRLAANFGIAAVYLTIFAFTFMTFLKLPYQHWLTTHRLLGISFLLGAIHAYLAPSNVLRSPFLSTWLAIWIFLGLLAAVYSIIFYRKFGTHYPYKINALEEAGDILNITLSSIKNSIDFVPGQFIYVRFHNALLGAELHPFSPSSTPTEETLRLSIKKIGDYTTKMNGSLQVGEKAEVYGPFGRFGEEYVHGNSDMIWIAGGIGVTPFLSMLRAEYLAPTNKKILFIYSLNKPAEAVFDAEILELDKKLPNITYLKWIADESGFLTIDTVNKKWAEIQGSQQPKMLLCGPPGMMHALSSQAIALGIPPTNVIFEEFSFGQ
jgi:predicted ferric reductase